MDGQFITNSCEMEFIREGATAVNTTAVDISDTSKPTWFSHYHPCTRFQYEPKNNYAATVQTCFYVGFKLQIEMTRKTPLLSRMHDLKTYNTCLCTIPRFFTCCQPDDASLQDLNTPTHSTDLQVRQLQGFALLGCD